MKFHWCFIWQRHFTTGSFSNDQITSCVSRFTLKALSGSLNTFWLSRCSWLVLSLMAHWGDPSQQIYLSHLRKTCCLVESFSCAQENKQWLNYCDRPDLDMPSCHCCPREWWYSDSPFLFFFFPWSFSNYEDEMFCWSVVVSKIKPKTSCHHEKSWVKMPRGFRSSVFRYIRPNLITKLKL